MGSTVYIHVIVGLLWETCDAQPVSQWTTELMDLSPPVWGGMRRDSYSVGPCYTCNCVDEIVQ